MRTLLLGLAIVLSASATDALPRSKSARTEFQRTNACPATGAQRGACPGWQIDHIVPLKCGGADTPANMQWLTIEDHKLKTKREARLCRPSRPASGIEVSARAA